MASPVEIRFVVNGSEKAVAESKKVAAEQLGIATNIERLNAQVQQTTATFRAYGVTQRDITSILKEASRANSESSKGYSQMTRELTKYMTDLEKTSQLLLKHAADQRKLQSEQNSLRSEYEKLERVREKTVKRMEDLTRQASILSNEDVKQATQKAALVQKYDQYGETLSKINQRINDNSARLKENVTNLNLADRAVGTLAQREAELIRTSSKASDEHQRLGRIWRDIENQKIQVQSQIQRATNESRESEARMNLELQNAIQKRRELSAESIASAKTAYDPTTIAYYRGQIEALNVKIDTLRASMRAMSPELVDLNVKHEQLGQKQKQVAAEMDRISEAEKKAAEATERYTSTVQRMQTPLQRAKNDLSEFRKATLEKLKAMERDKASEKELSAVRKEAAGIIFQMITGINNLTQAEYKNSAAGKEAAAIDAKRKQDLEWVNNLIQQGTPLTQRRADATERLNRILREQGISGSKAGYAIKGLNASLDTTAKTTELIRTGMSTVKSTLSSIAGAVGAGWGINGLFQKWVEHIKEIEESIRRINLLNVEEAQVVELFAQNIAAKDVGTLNSLMNYSKSLVEDASQKGLPINRNQFINAAGEVVKTIGIGNETPEDIQKAKRAIDIMQEAFMLLQYNPTAAKEIGLSASGMGYALPGQDASSLIGYISDANTESRIRDISQTAQRLQPLIQAYIEQGMGEEMAMAKASADLTMGTRYAADLTGRKTQYSFMVQAIRRGILKDAITSGQLISEFEYDEKTDTFSAKKGGKTTVLTDRDREMLKWVTDTGSGEAATSEEFELKRMYDKDFAELLNRIQVYAGSGGTRTSSGLMMFTPLMQMLLKDDKKREEYNQLVQRSLDLSKSGGYQTVQDVSIEFKKQHAPLAANLNIDEENMRRDGAVGDEISTVGLIKEYQDKMYEKIKRASWGAKSLTWLESRYYNENDPERVFYTIHKTRNQLLGNLRDSNRAGVIEELLYLRKMQDKAEQDFGEKGKQLSDKYWNKPLIFVGGSHLGMQSFIQSIIKDEMIDEQEKELLEAFRRSGWPNEMLEEVTKRTESSEKGKKLFIDYINSPPPNNNTSYFKPTQAPKNTLTPDFFSIPSLDNTYSSELFANNSPQKDFASLGNLTNDASSIDAIRQNTEATRELIELLGELKQQNLFARSNLGEFPYNEEYDA